MAPAQQNGAAPAATTATAAASGISERGPLSGLFLLHKAPCETVFASVRVSVCVYECMCVCVWEPDWNTPAKTRGPMVARRLGG